jgi:hypothetical protein
MTKLMVFFAHQSVHRESIFKNVPTRWHFFLHSILFPVHELFTGNKILCKKVSSCWNI